MGERAIPSGAEFWTRARRHLLKYGGEFVDFVPVRAEGGTDTRWAGPLFAPDLPEPTAQQGDDFLLNLRIVQQTQ